METVAALVTKLSEPDIDLFDQRQHREDVFRRGRDAVLELLPLLPTHPSLVEKLLLDTLRRIQDPAEREAAREDLEHQLAPNIDPGARQACMSLLAEQYPEVTHLGQQFLFYARNVNEPRDMRICALTATGKLKPASALGRSLVDLLGDRDPDIVHKVLGILRRYSGLVPVDEVVEHLERLASPTSNPVLGVRCAAIELLGQFGEVDILERVVLLPLLDGQEHEAVGRLVQHLLKKPRSVVRLSPTSFEHLVGRLLENLGYQSVKVQGRSGDGGVDVEAWREEERCGVKERLKWIVQCKRFRRSNLVTREVVERMEQSLKAAQAAHGIIITTSDFLPAAATKARELRHIKLIAGSKLQELLDTHMGQGMYRVPD